MRSVAFGLALLVMPLGAQATTIQSQLPDAQLRGAATYRYIGLPLYKAQLFTRSGAPLDWTKDFGLALTYLRNLTQYDLVEGTMRELARTGASLPVRDQLQDCFRDVHKGDRYLAISQGANQLGFWLNGERVCTLSHPAIKTRFMSIFLGDNSRSAAFTRKLKGE